MKVKAGDKVYCYWKSHRNNSWDLGWDFVKTLYTESFITEKGNLFFYRNEINHIAKYITLKELRKNKLNRICSK